MRSLLSACRTAAACVALVGSTCASAGPVVQVGSSYQLALLQQFDGVYETTVTFDGLAETFVYTPFGGIPVSLTVQESQVDLGAGRAAIDVSLRFAGGNPFPLASSLSIFGLGASTTPFGTGDALDLSSPVALTAALIQGVAGDGSLVSLDLMPGYRTLGFVSPWDGAMFSRGGPEELAWFVNAPWLGSLGLREVSLHFETQALSFVPSPGTLPLLGAALGLLALTGRRARA